MFRSRSTCLLKALSKSFTNQHSVSTCERRLIVPAFARVLSTQGSGPYDPTQDQPPLPEYVEREGETLEIQKARLLYQSRKRGMLENGLLLSTFAAEHLDSMTQEQTQLYDTLINKPSNDWDIYYWATGNKPTPPEYESEIMNMLKKHALNENRQNRSRQPDLKTNETA